MNEVMQVDSLFGCCINVADRNIIGVGMLGWVNRRFGGWRNGWVGGWVGGWDLRETGHWPSSHTVSPHRGRC